MKKIRINFGVKDNYGLAEVSEINSKIDLSKAERIFNLEEKFNSLIGESDSKENFSTEAFSLFYNQFEREEQALYRLWSIEVTNLESADKMLQLLGNNPQIEFAEFDELNELYSSPNDPLFPQLYGLEKISAEKAWGIAKGEEVTIAVVDTGVNYNHPDIKGNMWSDKNGNFGFDFSDNDPNPMDYHGHGTHVAGTISAVGNNREGIIGVAPKSKIMAIKIFPNAKDRIIAKALVYAIDNGAKVLNNSWGPRGRRPTNTVIEKAIKYVHSKGGICVFASGNNNDDVKYYSPANMDITISVGATDNQDRRAAFSNYGAMVDISAPGVKILSLKHLNASYQEMSGTSMSAPHVTGVVGLLRGKQKHLDFYKIKEILQKQSDSISTDKPIGKGRLNAFKTLKSS